MTFYLNKIATQSVTILMQVHWSLKKRKKKVWETFLVDLFGLPLMSFKSYK